MLKQNTYSLLVQSQEKGRSIFESAIYGLVIVSTAFTAWQFASSSVVLPGMNRGATNRNGGAVEMVAKVPAETAPVFASRS